MSFIVISAVVYCMAALAIALPTEDQVIDDVDYYVLDDCTYACEAV